jgi:hypothetical protein
MYQLRENIFPILLPSKDEAENFSDHPRARYNNYEKTVIFVKT